VRRFAAIAALATMPLSFAAVPPETRDSKRETLTISETDRIRLAEAFRLAGAIGDSIWKGWSAVPFSVVLVTPEAEFFVGHPHPPSDTSALGRDALLGASVAVRPRTFAESFLATFPIEGVSTVVVGRPEATGARSPSDWVVLLLHEHFHQLQDSQPRFFERVLELGLARGDGTGMWMLNFPFPYDAPAAAPAYSAAARALRNALSNGPVAAYLDARRQFRSSLGADDRKYLDFQIWKEGVARYTQIRVAEWAAEHGAPPPAFAALPGFVPYDSVGKDVVRGVERELETLSLSESRRIVFYALGACEALLLDRLRPCWRETYFERPFTLDPYFADDFRCENRPPTKRR
jgi:hypothetical protein